MTRKVVVVGGGYAGAATAKRLDEFADVTLIEQRDAFVHNTGSLRALVRPDWMPRIFIPYDRLLAHGRVRRDRVARIAPDRVTLSSGEEVPAEGIVLATGSMYPFPAKTDTLTTPAAQARYRSAHGELSAAQHVLLLGAGPVGIELAGEILAEWPSKDVTIVDPRPELLPGYPPELRDQIQRQLEALGVHLLFGTRIVGGPPGDPGIHARDTVRTDAGGSIPVDIWFRCYGVTPVSPALDGTLANALRPDGHIRVLPTLQVRGHELVFAVGDITDINEAKQASAAARHAELAATNIRTLLTGGGALLNYEVPPPAILLPLGPRGGAGWHPKHGLLGPEAIAKLKGEGMRLGEEEELFGRGTALSGVAG